MPHLNRIIPSIIWTSLLLLVVVDLPCHRPGVEQTENFVFVGRRLLGIQAAHAQVAPAKPTGLTALAIPLGVRLSWTDPQNSDITRWQYRYKTTGSYGPWWADFPAALRPSGGSYTTDISPLTGSTQYTFQIRAVAGTVDGLISDEVSATPKAPPAEPTGLTALAIPRGVRLSWTDPQNSDITGWQYRYKTTGSYDNNWTDFPASLRPSGGSYTSDISPLTVGTQYTFQIRARAGIVAGLRSDEVSATPKAPPAKPTGLTALAIPLGVRLSWTDPQNSDITRWQYRYKTTGSYGTWGNFPASLRPSGGSYTSDISPLTVGTQYTFQIRAVAGTVDGLRSDEVSATPKAPPDAPPAKPTGLTALAIPLGVRLSWTDPQNSDITRWQYRYKTTGSYGPWWADFPAALRPSGGSYTTDISPLTGSTQYTFQIRAVAGTVDGLISDEVSATPKAPPAEPTGLTALAIPRGVRLSWTDPQNSDITGWQYRYKTTGSYDNNWTDFPASLRPSGGSYTSDISPLTVGTQYTFQIRARAGIVAGLRSDEVSATPKAPPAKPTGLTALAIPQGVRLSWTDPQNSDITRWQYRYKTTGSYDNNWTDFPASLRPSGGSYTSDISPLTVGTQYTFQIRAVAGTVDGLRSDEVSATPKAPPAKPTGLTALAITRGVRLSWTDPQNSDITRWQYRYKTTGSYGDWADFPASLRPSGGSYTSDISHLTTLGTQHTFQIRARAGSSFGSPSDEVSATPVAPPAKPTGLTTRVGNETVVLSWTNPKNPDITSWEYRQKTDGSYGRWIPFTGSWPADKLTYERSITGLTNGTLYTFQLRALASLTFGTVSDEVSATPVAPPAEPTGLTTRVGNETVVLSWTNPKNPDITSWEYRQKTDGSYGRWIPFTGSWPADKLTYERSITGLTNGTLYTFQLRALASLTFGTVSDEVSATPKAPPAKPAKPTGLTAVGIPQAVRLSWTDPQNSDITRWQYRYKTTGSYGDWADFPASLRPSGGSYIRDVTDLTNGTQHTFQIRARAGIVPGSPSDEVSATPKAPPAKPAKPTGLTAVGIPQAVRLSWTDPQNSDITRWQYRYKTTGSYGDWADFPASLRPSGGSYIRDVTDLTNGTQHTFQIRARAGIVPGSPSDEVSATPKAPPAKPAKPTGLTALAITQAVRLSWTDPQNSDITRWQYRYKTTGSYGNWADFPASLRPSGGSYISDISPLTVGTQHTFQIRARAGIVPGLTSDEVSATPKAPPAKPTGLTALAIPQGVRLSWTDPQNSDITRWQYRYKTTGSYGTWGNFPASLRPSGGSYTSDISPLTVGTQYTFQIRATTNDSRSSPSDEVSATPKAPPDAPPAKPTGLTALAITQAVRLSWTDPQNSDITRWQYRYKTTGSYGTWRNFSSALRPSGGSYTSDISHLTTLGTQYTFQIRAVAGSREGFPSDEVSATPKAPPAKPTGLTALAITQAVRLSWTDPQNSDITRWQYRYKTTGSYGTWGNFPASLRPSGGSYTSDISPLTVGTQYTFQIRATTNDSRSSPSDEVSATPKAPPAKPTGLTALAIPQGVRLSWTDPQNSDITRWQYRYKTTGSYGDWADFPDVLRPSGGSYTRDIIHLTVGTQYTFQIRAVAGFSFGSPSDEVSATVIESGNTSPTVLPVLTISGGTAVTEGTAVSFTVTASPIPTSSSLIILRNVEDAPSGDFLAADEEGDSNTWLFPRGLASQTFTIPTVADDVEEQSGAIFVTLSPGSGYTLGRPSSAKVTVMDKETLSSERKATWAWQTRLGRTIAQQVVDAVQGRFTAPPPLPGLRLTVAGEDLTATPLEENQQALVKLLGFETVTTGQVVQDSSFSFSPPPAEDEEREGDTPRLSFWGQGALSSFHGQEDTLSLEGNVGTALLGADWRTTHWQAGAALSHSWGNGSYAGEDGNDAALTARLTGLFPYGRYALSPRLGVWAVAGYGWGTLSVKPDDTEREYQPTATMAMGAVGLDGLLIDGGADGFSLSATTDLLTVKTTTEETDGLAAAEGSVSRLRLGLEAVRPFPLPNGASLLPSMDVGIRHDGGDAETGFGMELGAGILWNDPQRGISAQLKGRSLVTHVEEEFRQQGLALSFSWNPDPATNRGPSLAIGHTVGDAASGMDALLSPTVLEGGGAAASSNSHRFTADLAYGFPIHHNRLTLTPAVAVALAPDSNTYSLLWSLAPYAQQGQTQPWQLSLEGEREENTTTDTPVDHSLTLNFSLLL